MRQVDSVALSESTAAERIIAGLTRAVLQDDSATERLIEGMRASAREGQLSSVQLSEIGDAADRLAERLQPRTAAERLTEYSICTLLGGLGESEDARVPAIKRNCELVSEAAKLISEQLIVHMAPTLTGYYMTVP